MAAHPVPRRSVRALLAENEARAQELLVTDLPERPSNWTIMRNASRMHDHIVHGQPPFAHNTHVILSIITGGLWLPVYWLAWLVSPRRRYQRSRRAVLRAEGLL